jgi:hypothetical protein
MRQMYQNCPNKLLFMFVSQSKWPCTIFLLFLAPNPRSQSSFLLIISYKSYFFRLVPAKPQTNTNLVNPNASQPNSTKQKFQRKSFTSRVSHACYSGHVSKILKLNLLQMKNFKCFS